MPWQWTQGKSRRGGQGWSHGWQNSGKADANVHRWWKCTAKDCLAELKQAKRGPWMNNPDSATCGLCGGPPPSASSNDLAAMRERLKAKKATTADPPKPKLPYAQMARSAMKVDPPAVVEVAESGSEAEEEEEPLLTDINLTEEFVAVQAQLKTPWELAEDWDPEKAFAKFLPKRSKGQDTVKLNEDLEQCKSVLAAHAKKLPGMANLDTAATKKKVELLEKQLEKANADQEDADTASLAACELELSRKQYETAEKTRIRRADAAEIEAESHADRLEEICTEQAAAWEAMLEKIRRERAGREAAWRARRAALENRHLQVQEVADKAITAAKDKAGEPADPSVPSAAQTVNLQLADALADLKKFREEAKKQAEEAAKAAQAAQQVLMDRIAALEAPAASTVQTAAARLSEAIHTQCNRTVMYTEAELPQLLNSPDAVTKQHLAQLQVNLAAWGQEGHVPITFEQLLAGTPRDQLDNAFITLQQATGQTIWTRFYGQGQAESHNYVPFQLGVVLNASLARAGTKLEELENGEKLKKQAEKQFHSFSKKDDAAKKARTGPYGQ